MQRRRALPAACAVVLLVVAQLIGLSHQAQTRHIICAKHGEQLEAAILVGAQHVCGQSHWVGVEGNAGGHSECELARALHQSAASCAATAVATPVAAAPVVLAVRTPDVRHAVVYRTAPKTSPPASLS